MELTITTKRGQMAAYETLGIVGEAAELLDKFSGNPTRRHEWRVDQTRLAVEAWDTSVGVRCAGWVALIVDLVGVGGKLGLTGAGTDRHLAFSALGKGRKQASDGPAWLAAAEELLRNNASRFTFSAEDGMTTLKIEPEDTLEIETEGEVLNVIATPLTACVLGECLVPVLFHCLRASITPVAGWHPANSADHYLQVGGSAIAVTGTPAEWANALNTVLAACGEMSGGWGTGTHYQP